MSDTEIRMMRYTIEELSAELQATRQYVSDIKTELERTRKALYLAFEMLKDIKNDPDTNDELTQEIADRLDEITALEKSELENLEMLVNNVFK